MSTPPSPSLASTQRKQRLPVSRQRRWKLLLSYAPDWVVTIAVTALFYGLATVHGFWRHFSLTDTSIQYPYTQHERVPDWLLVVLSLACPLVIMPVINLLSIRSWWDWHNSWLGLILSWGLTGTLTNIVKITAGRPRPDLLARCQPMAGAENAAVYGLVDYTVCTQTDEGILKDGFRSFFSGHSSASFAGLGFLFFYGAGKLHLFDHRGQALKAWVAFIPLVGASLIAITRTMDYRHHPTDVLIGSIVGLVVSHFCYRQYFPSLTDALSHRPYSPRIPREPSPEEKKPLPTPGPDDTVQRENPELETVWQEGRTADHAGTVPRPDDTA